MSETTQPVSGCQALIDNLSPYEQSILVSLSLVRGVKIDSLVNQLLSDLLRQQECKQGNEFAYYAKLFKFPSSRDFVAYCRENPREAFDKITRHRLNNLSTDFTHCIIEYELSS